MGTQWIKRGLGVVMRLWTIGAEGLGHEQGLDTDVLNSVRQRYCASPTDALIEFMPGFSLHHLTPIH